MENFSLKVLTPVGVVLTEEQVIEVSLPSSNGEIGILPGHVRYSGLLGSGTLKYRTEKEDKKALEISQGFCDFDGQTLLVLADKVLS